ncbi:MAG: MFS transporter [Opitutaceae bacterium]
MNATTATTSATKKKDDLARSFRLCTADGIVAMPIVTMSLPVNVFITALVTKAFVLPKPAIGLLTAMPFIANFFQIFAAPFIARWRPPKTVTVTAACTHLVLWIMLGIGLPWIPHTDATVAARWLTLWFFISSCFAAVAGVSWNSWVQEWVPARLRGKYFSRRNAYLQFSTLAFLFFAGWTLAHWNYAIAAFQVVIAVSCFVRIYSIYWQWIAPTRSLPRTIAPVLTLREQFQVLQRSRSFLLFMVFGSVWSFAANCFGPFYHVFMFEQLNFSAFDVGILSTLTALGGALALPAWGRLLDRFGNKPVMTFALITWQLQNFLWCFITPANRELLYGMWVFGGLTSACFILGQFTLLLRLLPVEAKNLAIGFNLAITSLVAAVAPIIGGGLLQWALARWSDDLAVYHVCFLLQPLLSLVAAGILLRVHEPAAGSLTMVFGAMRNIRTLGGVLGLDFLINYVFYRAPSKRR